MLRRPWVHHRPVIPGIFRQGGFSMIDRMTRKPSDGFLAIVLDAYSLFIQRRGSGVICGRSRGPDVSVDRSPVIST